MEEMMFKHICLSTALATVVMVASSAAQTIEGPNNLQMTAVTELGGAETRTDTARPTQALLTEIVTWLSSNFDLPANYDHPNFEFVPAVRLATLRYSGLLPDRWHDTPAATASQLFDVVALYHDKKKTIYLADTWTGATATELSMLVHEIVHHLQNLGEIKYECPAAREKPAYLAQDEWLKRNGLDLEQAFELDKFTLLVKSSCMF
jgi:Domain of unknown function (DUF6647)